MVIIEKGIVIFENEEFGKVRTVDFENNIWFVAKDITDILGYSNSSKAISDHCKGYNETLVPSNGGNQIMKIIPERDVYRLIMKSRLPNAEKFEEWVVSEVLPTIRKTGGYINNTDLLVETYFSTIKPEQKMIIKSLLDNIQEQQSQIKILKPKGEYFDTLVERNLLTNFRDTAKEFKLGQKKFVSWLIDNGYIFRDTNESLKPCTEFVNNGMFEIKEWKTENSTGIQTLITPKGRETFRILLK